MAALRSLLKKRFIACNDPMTTMMKRKLSSQPFVDDSSSFAQRIRDLPKDLPGTNIKKEVSQVISLSLSLSLSYVDFKEFQFSISISIYIKAEISCCGSLKLC
jgi:hypothetical protein